MSTLGVLKKRSELASSELGFQASEGGHEGELLPVFELAISNSIEVTVINELAYQVTVAKIGGGEVALKASATDAVGTLFFIRLPNHDARRPLNQAKVVNSSAESSKKYTHIFSNAAKPALTPAEPRSSVGYTVGSVLDNRANTPNTKFIGKRDGMVGREGDAAREMTMMA
ncbi:hypothetical protein RhiXN_05170 [Rhizoctonia solani]|uniref:Uncharacterized protein n=1 Tax=Rhizoctonia solani TaxID=456999 RepID=A0A8H8NRT4_9AGAM|nr:uncharacterized protein RhiXN_05170 [Rhizoctonia solani]QRW17168.1 hypothetical protein RhiXN_05170 [Rhizoctonia solani]